MIEKNLSSKSLPKVTNKIAVAVSGGADSMCLVALLHKRYKNLTALIVDHGLRKESSKEAALVRSRLEKMRINAQILKWVGDKPKSNIHEHARKARYKLLTDYCQQHKIKSLFFAHTKNDQAETVLLRIYRGTGIDGLVAMQEKSIKNNINIFRPLLDVTRPEIEAYLKEHKIKWVDDPSNFDTKYERVKIRNLINSLKDKSTWIDRLNLLANNSKRSSDYIKAVVRKKFAKIVRIHDLGFIDIKHEDLSKLHEEIALKLLVKIFSYFNGSKHQPRLRSLSTCLESLLNKKDMTLAGVEIKNIKGMICFIREPKAIENFDPNNWDNRFVLADTKQDIRPLGEDGWKQIKAKIKTKTWPHIKVVYSLPAIFKNGKVVECSILGFFSN